MVRYNEIRVSQDGGNLLLDVVVSPYRYYDRMHISAIYAETEGTFVAGSPSSSAVCLYEDDGSKALRHVRLTPTPSDLGLGSFAGHVIYVYAACGGFPSPDVPCMMDAEWTLGVTLDWRPVYREGMAHITEVVGKSCGLPRAFIDYALRLEALRVALECGQYSTANELIKIFGTGESASAKSGCGCG